MLTATTHNIRELYKPQNIGGSMIQWMNNNNVPTADKTAYVPAKTKSGTQRVMLKTFDIDLFIEKLEKSIITATVEQHKRDRTIMLARAIKIRELIISREAGSE